MLTRYVIKADGEIIGHAEREEKAWKIAHKFEYECLNQDDPCFPKMEVTRETIS